jgi:xanthine dehydrogenase YagS FAD-binding subunit
MRAFTLQRPTGIAAARCDGGMYIGGGTDMMQLLKDDVFAPASLTDLLPVLGTTIASNPTGLRIEAGARMADVGASPVVAREAPAVARALLLSASPQVRNMATIGGNLLQRTRCGYFRDVAFACNKRAPGSGCPAQDGENRNLAVLGTSDHCIATYAGDLAVALVALDAVVELSGPVGPREVALVDFHRAPGDTPQIETVLRPEEVIVAIRVPVSDLARRSHYVKIRDRASFEWALVSAAVALDVADGQVRDARVALGGVGTKPWRSPEAEAALRGQPATEATYARAAEAALRGARPRDDNAFKVTLAQRTLVRALVDAT